MKLPEFQATGGLNLRMRTAATRSAPAMMASPQQRFVAEVTSDQITRQALTTASANQSVANNLTRTVGNYLQKARQVQAQIDTVEAEASGNAAYQAYMRHMLDFKATRTILGSNLERTDSPDSVLGFNESRDWEALDADYVQVSDQFVSELNDVYLTSSQAKKIFAQKRNTLDKQNIEDIYKFQRDQKIDLATARIEESNSLDSSVSSIELRTTNAIKAGLPAAPLLENAAKNIKRVNYSLVENHYVDFQTASAITNPEYRKFNQELLETRWEETLDYMDKPDLLLPESAKADAFKLYQDTSKMLVARDKRASEAAYNITIEQAFKSDNPQELLTVELSKVGARDMYGERFDDLVEMAQTAQQTGATDRDIYGQLDLLIMERGGFDGDDDSFIRSVIVNQQKNQKLNKSDAASLLGKLNSKIQDRRSGEEQLAKAILMSAIVGPGANQANLETYLDSEYGSRIRGIFTGSLIKLDKWRRNNPDGDLVGYAEKLVLESVKLEKWMVDSEGKRVTSINRIGEIDIGLSRDMFDQEKQKIESTSSADSNMNWEAQSLEKIRRIESIQLMMTEINEVSGDDSFQSNYLEDVWMTTNTPGLLE